MSHVQQVLSGLLLVASLLVGFAFITPVASAHTMQTTKAASTCGGNIVYWTTDTYHGQDGSVHHAIFVDTGNQFPAITKITFNNETVPNADYGVTYSTPIGRSGNSYIYGVSTRWTLYPQHWSWHDTFRWRIFYNC